MWVRDLRAVTFGDAGVLRRPVRPDALANALHRTLETRGASISREAFAEVWSRATRERAEARWSDLVEEPMEASLESILPEGIGGLDGIVAATVESLASSTEWFPDALPTLDFLQEAGCRVAIVCDSSMPFGATWQARVAPWVQTAVLSRDVGHVKPHVAVFKEVLGRLGLLPKQVLHVGDQLVADVFGAKAVGLRTVLLERVPRDPPPAESFVWLKRVHGMEPQDVIPDLKIRTLEEVPAVLEQFA